MPNPPQRKTNRTKTNGKLGVAPNVKAAAGRLGISVEMIRGASEAGCDAIQANGKVHMDRLAAWLAENPEFVAKWSGKDGGIPPKAISQAIKEHFAALEAKRKHEEKIGKLILREKIAGIVA